MEIGIIEALSAVISSHVTWMGLAALLVLGFVYRWAIKGESPKKILGFANGYVQEKSFLGAMSRMEKLIEDKADAEDKRMTKHSKEIGDLREAVQCLDRKVEKVSTKVEMMEQYRGK